MSKTEVEPKRLTCGGKGPCCHIGYPHRHCEHCDVVIDERPANWWYTWPYLRPYYQQPYYGTFGLSAGNQTNPNTNLTFTQLQNQLQAPQQNGLAAATAMDHTCEVGHD